MSVSIDILPFSRSLELDGEADPSSAYSLSGHVSISLKPSYSMLGCRRYPRFFLQSLVLVFEGQTELVTTETGYSAYRICSVTKELAPSDPLQLTNEGFENSDNSCTWNVVFNLAIPGWLPPSSNSGGCEDGPVSILYSLHATAKFVSTDEPSCSTFFGTRFWAPFCAPPTQSSKIIRAPRCDITINRVITPPISSSSLSSTIPYRTFFVQVNDNRTNTFPPDVLSKIRVAASIPEYVDIDEDKLQLRLRVRAEGLNAVHCQRLRMSSFTIDIQQQEKYRTQPSREYTLRFPVLPESSQPPHQPLLTFNSLQQLQVLGMLPETNENTTVDRSFSLLSDDSSGVYQLAGDGYIFVPEAEESDEESPRTWYSMETSVPFNHTLQCVNKSEANTEWAGDCVLRTSGTSPLFLVRHQLLLSMICTYDVEGDPAERITAKLQFGLPILFARTKKSKMGCMHAASFMQSQSSLEQQPDMSTTVESAGPSTPRSPCYYVNTLPAYSQLFDSNGDRKIDYSLPVYTPASRSPSSSPICFDET